LDFQLLTRGASVELLSWLTLATGSFPQLQKLDVVTTNSLLKIPNAFLAAPALREVILTDRKFTFNSPGSINIPWAQITHYRGKFHRERQLEILRDAPALLECAMGLVYDYFIGQNGSFAMVTMPRLRRLCVKGTRILDSIETPVLQSLFSLQNPTLDNILPFIRRSACPLTKLVLMQCRISSELITLLQILPPTLIHLVIGCQFDAPRMPSTLLSLMTISAAVPDLCPNLTSFWYGYEPAEDEEDSNFPRDPFFAMVQSRLQPTRPFRLACLRVFHTHESLFAPSDDVVTRMETLRDGGLDAVFLSHQAFETQKDFV
jgi:hypothetical protein